MAEINPQNLLLDEMVTFIQNDLPGFDAGQYELSFDQVVNDSSGGQLNTNVMEQSYTFAVTGDRFYLKNPNDTLYSVFPAAGASGEYSTVLPHVVFNKTILPWLRYPTTDLPDSSNNQDVPTWLTVILLDEDDVLDFPGLLLPAQSATVGDLFPHTINSNSSLAAGDYSYFDQANSMDELDPGETATDSIKILDLPLDLFYKIAPTVEDLKKMAHVREVSLANKPTMKGISDVGKNTGQFSIVFGNRLPIAGKKSYAYLVSLEQLELFLPSDEEGGGNPYGADKNIRLAVLKNWTFFATAETATFVDRVQALNGVENVVDSIADAPAYANLCIPYDNVQNQQLSNALSMGYAPMNYQFRNSDKSVAWYRGPFLPYSETNSRVELPVSSPDRANIFDPTTGLFDISYSAAWTLGRLMALQSSTFSTRLYNWKKKLSQQVMNNIENAILEKQYRFLITPKDHSAEAKKQSKKTTAEEAISVSDKKATQLQDKWMTRTILGLKTKKINKR